MFDKAKFYVLLSIFLNWGLVQGCTLGSDPSGCTYPQQVCTLVNILKKNVEKNNRLLLHGSYGTGKSTLARLMARETNSEIIEIRCSELVGPFAGEASQKITEYIQQAMELHKSTGKRIIFHFDEADAIAHKITSQNQSNHEQRTSGLQTLWQYLDKYSRTNRADSPEDVEFKKAFFFIFSTNRHKDLDSAFLSRFQKIIKLENPDATKRKKMARFYAVEHKLNARISEQEMNKVVDRVVKKTDKLSLRSVEQVFTAIAERSDACECFKNEFIDEEVKIASNLEKDRIESDQKAQNDGDANFAVNAAKYTVISSVVGKVMEYTPTAVSKLVEKLPQIYETVHYYAPTLTDMTVAGGKKLASYAWYIWTLKNGG